MQNFIESIPQLTTTQLDELVNAVIAELLSRQTS
jgi:hypothetical protein